MMASKKVLSRNQKFIPEMKSVGNFNGDVNLCLNDSYFVNLNIVNTSKGINKSQTEKENLEQHERQRILDLQKFRSSGANQDCSEHYLATTIAQLSRRDKLPGDNDVSGSFKDINPILNKTISRVLIYGSPGTGKTTLCKKIVHDFYKINLWNHLDEVIWIPLRQLKDPKYEDEQMSEEKLLKMFLNEENLNLNFDNLLFILDGWDEIQDLFSDPKKIKLVETINKIKDRKNLILTSRPYVQLNFADYQRVLEITGFNAKNVRDYIQTFLKQNNRLSEQKNIMQYISNNLLSDLVTIPIILEIFLFAWQEISTMDKNDITTTKLYKTFILKLLKNFLIKSGKAIPEDLTMKNLINGPLLKEFKILRDMARKWLENGSLQFIYKDFEDVNDKLESKLPFLNTSAMGEDWKSDRSEFVHLTFLEFFAAFELINRDEEDFRQFISENKFNPKYFVVLTFAAGLIDEDLHNLKEFSESSYRYTKEEKLELYFDYLQSDPVDLSGKYIYMLLVDCIHECKLSKSRETSIYQEIASFVNLQHYQTGIDGSKVVRCLRRFPLGLLEEYFNVGEGSLYQLSYFRYNFPQLTDAEVERIFKVKHTSETTKLDILSMQSSFSSYCSDVLLKLTTFESLRSSYKTYSNLPLKVLEKMLKLVIHKDLFENEEKSKEFLTVKGVSCQDAIQLCSQLVKIEKNDSIQEIIVKLIISDVDYKQLFLLYDVYEFAEEMPGAILGVLNNDQYTTDIHNRALNMISKFECNSTELVDKLLRVSNTDKKLKYQALKTLSYIFHKTEMPADVSSLLLKNVKSLLAAEKERVGIQNRLVKNYLLSTDRESRNYSFYNDWRINQGTYTMKELVNCLKGRVDQFVAQLLIEMFLGTSVSELPLDIIRKEERGIFKIFPFIFKTKTENGKLVIKAAIMNIINSEEDILREMVNTFEGSLICEAIKETLADITGKERHGNWQWTVKRMFYTLMEIQRNDRNQPKCAPKNGDEKCVHHAHLMNSEVLREFFDNEGIKLDKTIESVADAKENLLDTMMYICYEQNNDADSYLLWMKLLDCGVEDSEYQEKATEHIIEIFSQDIEVELRCLLLSYLSDRVHRMTKEQLMQILKYEGVESDYQLNENSNQDRSFLSTISDWAKSSLLANHKFINDCEYFSKDEQLELRKLSPSYDKFCREESDLDIQQQIEELSLEIREIMASSKTKDLMNVISEYMKTPDYYAIDAKMKVIDPEMNVYVLQRFSKVVDCFFPEKFAKQFNTAYFICEQDSNADYTKFIKNGEKLKDKSFSNEIIEKIYEKLDDDVLGGFFLKLLESNYHTKIVQLVKCIHESSTEKQKSFMTYAILQSLISLTDDVSVYVFNNDLYIGTSVSDRPALSNLNPSQIEVLFNAKCIANSNGFNIKHCGIAQNIQSYENVVAKCKVMDLSDKEQLLKNKKHLNLSNQNIKEAKEIEKIFNFIKKYPVETLILSNNQITGEMFEFLIRNLNETHVKYLILHSNAIQLDKFGFRELFADEDSNLQRNKTLLLLDIANNPTSISWLENFEKLENKEKFSRKDSEGNILVHGYNVNNANVILYRSGLNKENGDKCQIM